MSTHQPDPDDDPEEPEEGDEGEEGYAGPIWAAPDEEDKLAEKDPPSIGVSWPLMFFLAAIVGTAALFYHFGR